jgi:hypothetical protein
MKTVWKKRKLSRSERTEAELSDAIREKNRDRVSTLLSKLHHMGVNQGFAVEDARRFLRDTEVRQRR